MELQHFSHEHPLMFIDEFQNEEGREQVVCYGCQKSISGSAYHCGECNYFLHKKCAELPMEINCPLHYQHPLTLLPHPLYAPSKSCECKICGKDDWEWFTYNCSLCEFDVDVLCILEEESYTMITHEGHPHPLTLLLKEVSFLCTACHTIEKVVSYLCTKCQFWIHKSCAFTPTTITHCDHDHPLVLGYSLPYEYRRFIYYCEICKEKVHPSFWVYYCDKCRYFVHMKCATSEITRDDKAGKNIVAEDPTIIQFPLTAKGLIDLQSELLNKVINLGDKERSPDINDFSHEHPLALFGEQSNSITNNAEVLCDCCIRPLTSAPFYGCSQCSFFLHTSCTELPDKLQHPCHPEHLLYLCAPLSFVEGFWCHGCLTYGNGFFYWCKSCDYFLDISCAFFPKKVKHEVHKHPLHIEWNDTGFVCNPCNGRSKGGFRFACDACNFHIEINCFRMPRTFKHDWDRHPLTLSYPPYSDHPDAFYCEICEEEIYPKSWVYRCRICVQFFHLYCAIPFDEFWKTKFGGTLKVENHPHTLTFVRKSENKSPSSCDRCGEDSKAANPIVECAPCNFVICRECCWSII